MTTIASISDDGRKSVALKTGSQIGSSAYGLTVKGPEAASLVMRNSNVICPIYTEISIDDVERRNSSAESINYPDLYLKVDYTNDAKDCITILRITQCIMNT